MTFAGQDDAEFVTKARGGLLTTLGLWLRLRWLKGF